MSITIPRLSLLNKSKYRAETKSCGEVVFVFFFFGRAFFLRAQAQPANGASLASDSATAGDDELVLLV